MDGVTYFVLLAWIDDCLQGGPAGAREGGQRVASPAVYTVAFVCVSISGRREGGDTAHSRLMAFVSPKLCCSFYLRFGVGSMTGGGE